MVDKGLTGIREEARGFVGSKPPPFYDVTKSGRTRIKFELACGKNNEKVGKFPTWRHCIAYEKIADQLKDLKIGDLVKVNGWVSTEWLTDQYFKPVQDTEGRTRLREYLILYKAEVFQYEKQPEVQPSLLPS